MVADKPFVRGVARFARKPGRAGVNPGLAVQRYAAGQERFIGYMSTAKTHLDARGFRIMPRQLCLRLSQRLYRAFRKAYGDDVFALCVEPVAVAVRRGMTLEVALFVVRVSRLSFGLAFSDEEFARIRMLVKENLRAGKGEDMKKTEDGGKKTEDGGGAKASSAKRRPEPQISFAHVMAATPLERIRKAGAEKALREALGVHQPLVKECVALRLCKHLGFDELAERLDLTRRDVEEILEKMRPWVKRYTAFFDSDWYWQEAASPETGI